MIPLVLSRLAKVISTRDEITEQLVNFQREGLVGKDNPVSVIIDGKSLTFALDPSLKKDFLELCCSCQGRTGLNAIATICQLYLRVLRPYLCDQERATVHCPGLGEDAFESIFGKILLKH